MKSKTLTTLNLEPFLRNAIGVDQFMNNMMSRVEGVNGGNYPPYNIIAVDEDHYKIEVAVAGFVKNELEVTTEDNQLVIVGQQNKDAVADDTGPIPYIAIDNEALYKNYETRYLYRGISSRTFERSFALADYVEVKDAEVKNGILTINLERIVPDALKPKEIKIKFK